MQKRRNDGYLAGPFASSGLGTPPNAPLGGSYGLDSEPDMRRHGGYRPTPTQAKVQASLDRQYSPPSIAGEPLYARRSIQDHVKRIVRLPPVKTTFWGTGGN